MKHQPIRLDCTDSSITPLSRQQVEEHGLPASAQDRDVTRSKHKNANAEENNTRQNGAQTPIEPAWRNHWATWKYL